MNTRWATWLANNLEPGWRVFGSLQWQLREDRRADRLEVGVPLEEVATGRRFVVWTMPEYYALVPENPDPEAGPD